MGAAARPQAFWGDAAFDYIMGPMAPESSDPTGADLATSSDARLPDDKKVAIYVVALNAAGSLSRVLDRIPGPVRERVDEILVCDAGSRDDTYLVGVGYKTVTGDESLTVIRSPAQGFGANSKTAIDHCRDRGHDVVVLLHGDGKYAPEVIDTLIQPLVRGEVDVVFGSRFLEGNPRKAGMPLHKYVAIRILSALQNALLDLDRSEYHCGYQAYSIPAIAELPYALNSDHLVFDTEIAIQIRQKGLRALEVPVPVYSGEETDSIRGVGYVLQVLGVLAEYWLHSRGIREVERFAVSEKYVYKDSPDASHQKILGLVDKDRQSILDVGCGAGYLAEALAVRGNRVTGVDARRVAGVEERVCDFLQVDLDREPIPWTGPPFPFVVLADVLEHLREPEVLLAQCHKLLAEHGALIVSVPNVAHWSIRLSLLFGRFSYTARGILDRTHLRFYTLSSIQRELESVGFEVERVEETTPPFDELLRGGGLAWVARLLGRVHVFGNRFWRELFAYQFILRARKTKA